MYEDIFSQFVVKKGFSFNAGPVSFPIALLSYKCLRRIFVQIRAIFLFFVLFCFSNFFVLERQLNTIIIIVDIELKTCSSTSIDLLFKQIIFIFSCLSYYSITRFHSQID